ncbi:hypothetical protein BN871_BY_00100 [Paenibacillus sp. P22]|nr:hypothetical protein BN871_BY_00100 [Paenibacillus sp. P22]
MSLIDALKCTARAAHKDIRSSLNSASTRVPYFFRPVLYELTSLLPCKQKLGAVYSGA